MTQTGDIIIAVDGHSVKQFEDIINYLEIHKSVGNNAKITVNRHGQIIDLNVVLQALPSLPP
jgi:S1-C subfamily serine protease